jgi:hypothetical protein
MASKETVEESDTEVRDRDEAAEEVANAREELKRAQSRETELRKLLSDCERREARPTLPEIEPGNTKRQKYGSSALTSARRFLLTNDMAAAIRDILIRSALLVRIVVGGTARLHHLTEEYCRICNHAGATVHSYEFPPIIILNGPSLSCSTRASFLGAHR